MRSVFCEVIPTITIHGITRWVILAVSVRSCTDRQEKDLDDKKITPEERNMWNESDVKAWSQWIENGLGANPVAMGGTRNPDKSNQYSVDAACMNSNA